MNTPYEDIAPANLNLNSDPDYVLSVAKIVEADLRNSGIRYKICGSIRRGLPPHDIDIVVNCTPRQERNLAQWWQEITDEIYPPYEENNDVECRCFTYRNVKIDLLITLSLSFPFSTLFLTGDRWFGECMREQAIQKSLMLTPYGLVDPYFGRCFPAISEEDIFKILGVPYIPPAERETYV